ncbi:MAG: hypothetical protein H6R13_1922 [Proteobacteria bacterium]|nr:hypothetical protein [Pseudomonadota bacterium]
MTACRARLFLLWSIRIKKKKEWADLTSCAVANPTGPAANLWRKMDVVSCKYQESSDKGLDYRSALDQARNFSPFVSRSIDEFDSLEKNCAGVLISGRDISLIRDEHGNFLLILAYSLSFEISNALSAVSRLFKNRGVLENLGEAEVFEKAQALAKAEIALYAEGLLGEPCLSLEDIELHADAAFPLLISECPAPANIESLFLNEENKVQRTEKSPLALDYESSFFHVGWNYTLAFSLPREVNEQVFVIMAKMQMSYYTFRYYKEYFEEAISDLADSADYIDHEVVDFFDRLKIGYQGFLSQYTKFKLGLYPKYFAEFEKIEALWHIDKDIQLISELLTSQTEFVNKRHSLLAERLSTRQQKTLALIAMLQVLAFMSVFFDSYQFLQADSRWFGISVFAVVCFLVAALVRYGGAPSMEVGKRLRMAKYKNHRHGKVT